VATALHHRAGANRHYRNFQQVSQPPAAVTIRRRRE